MCNVQNISWSFPEMSNYMHYPKFEKNKSVFLIGDSTDRNKINAVCGWFKETPVSYIEGLHLENSHGNSGYASCDLGNIVVGQFMHYGVMDQPYFQYAYPIPFQLQNESYAHISKDATRFRTRINGQDPTLIVVQSYAWDIAAECQRNRHHVKSDLLKGNVEDWFQRNLRMLTHVRNTFPQSRIMWRTSHPYTEYCATRSLIDKMNQIMRTRLPAYGIHMAEWNLLMTSPSTPKKCKNKLHVSDECNLPYMNIILNQLLYNKCRTGR